MNKFFPIIQSSAIEEIKYSSKNLKGLYCLDPFIASSIDGDGNVRLCSCLQWNPTIVGNLKDNTIEEILNSELAHKMRESIRNGTYEYCNENKCGIIINNRLLKAEEIPHDDAVGDLKSTYDRVFDVSVVEPPRQVTIAGDLICNLSCPSCRTELIKQSDDVKDGRKTVMELINKNLFSKSDPRYITIYLSLNGEVFASPEMLKFLETFPVDRYPAAEFKFQTNGLLIKKRWNKIKHLKKNIFNITISADSQNPATYEKLRRGGSYSELLENLEFVSKIKQELGFEFVLRMVLQNDNATEIKEFFDFGMKYNADIVEYQFFQQHHHIDDDTFKAQNVLNTAHPHHDFMVSELRALKKQHGSKVVIYHGSII
jgi:MoaA/NifB/PqqE/SkfB family radical SAM enzyme